MLLLLACTAPDPKDTSGPDAQDPDGNTLTVTDDGALEWGDRRVELSIGEVAAFDETTNYEPMNLYEDLEPSGFHWRAATAASKDGDHWTVRFEGGWEGTLTLDDTGPGIRVSLTGLAADTPYVRVAVDAGPSESFYGLGEWFDGAEHRGHVHPMQFRVAMELESGYNEAHVPIPFLTSTAGWGLLVDSDWPGLFDVASSDPDRVQAIFAAPDLTFDLYGAAPRDALARYHARTGYPEVPPDWAFAPLQWRDEGTAADVLADATAMRAAGVPGGCLWIDNPWQTSYNSMVPDEDGRYPDWDAMIATLEAQGFRMLTWTTPYVEEADSEYATYEANGWFVPLAIEFNPFGPLVDFTNPDAAAAWEARVAAAEGRGIQGWKLDYGEDIQLGLLDARLQTAFANGEDERTMHHRFVTYYHDRYDADGEAFLLGRTGVKGGQVLTDTIWPGDLDSDFRTFGEDGHVGGLPSAVRGGTGLAASGYPFFASDTGGYRHDRPTEEVFLRWTEYAALLPIFQYGGSGADHNPWNFEPDGESVFTEATLDTFRRYAVLHTRLFPYFSALAERAATEGQPVVMARGFAYPDEGEDPEDVFLVGDDLLVAVVETAGAVEKSVVLPEGGWVHWWSGERYEGTVTVPAPLGEGPLFQREGSAIPLLRPEVMTLATTDGSVESWADDPGRLNARIVGDGAFTLSTGEAVSCAGDTCTLTAGSRYAGWDLEIWGSPTAVAADGAALDAGAEGCAECWYTDGTWVHVVVDGAETVTLTW